MRVGWGIGGGQDYGSEGELGLVCKIIIFIKKQYQPVKSFKEYVLENNWGDSLLRNQSKDQSIKDYSDWNNYTGESMECEYKNLLTMMGYITTFVKPSHLLKCCLHIFDIIQCINTPALLPLFSLTERLKL